MPYMTMPGAMPKRHHELFDRFANFASLHAAAKTAVRGKRRKPGAAAFFANFEREILELERELQAGTYRPGRYVEILVRDPKERLVSAAPFRDRVVHHALCSVIAPIFEAGFIANTFANRVGKGTHRAIASYERYRDRHAHVLRCDIFRYFPAIDHAILKTDFRRRIACERTLWLMDTIVDASNAQEPVELYFAGDDLFTPHRRRRGLPIGNLTSQFFANIYLNPFDHFVTKELRTAKYVRYVDDFALFSDDRAWLTEARVKIETWLTKLRLQIHGVKSQLFETRHGASFVGFQVLPETVRVKNENLRRARRRMKHLQKAYRRGEKDLQQITQCVRSWIAHLEHGNTWQLRTRIFNALAFVSG